MQEHDSPPTRDQVARKLRELIAGDITPEAASEWASPWITRTEEVGDAKAKRALVELAGADMPSTDREYLFAKIDFEAWLRELDTGSP
jgi:hypothetical protein